jgi:hypothetical protein
MDLSSDIFENYMAETRRAEKKFRRIKGGV